MRSSELKNVHFSQMQRVCESMKIFDCGMYFFSVPAEYFGETKKITSSNNNVHHLTLILN